MSRFYQSFKTPMDFLSFPFLFPSFLSFSYLSCCSVVSDGRNQSSFVFFYVVFESLYGCVNAVFDAASPLPTSFLGTYSLFTSSLGCNALCMVISSLVHLSKFISGPIEKWSRISNEVYSPSIYSFDKVYTIEVCLEKFSISPEISFWILFFVSTFSMVSASKILKYL